MGFGHSHDHSHAGPHDHSHGHAHGPPKDFGRAFAVGIFLNVIFIVVETTFGFLANSVALLADAGHNLSDVLGLIIAWIGAIMAKRTSSRRFTFGLKKASILAALFNALILLVAVGAIVFEAIKRFYDPAPVAGGTVMIVAGIGILINGVTAMMFMSGRNHDINIRGAYLHMAADAGVSAAVVVAGLAITLTGALWVDPLMSLIVAVVIFWGTWGLLKDSVWMSLAGAPKGMDLDKVEAALAGLPGVTAVHDLHVWHMSTTEIALTAHLTAPKGDADGSLLLSASKALRDDFGIKHCTIQIELGAPEELACQPC